MTTHARLELYRYLECVKDHALYCDIDSIIYRHVDNIYNPPLSECVGGMTDELAGSYMREYVSNQIIVYIVQATVNMRSIRKVSDYIL